MATKIRSTKGIADTKLNFPDSGAKHVDADGIVEIEHDHVAAALVAGDDWELVEEAPKKAEKKQVVVAKKSVVKAKVFTPIIEEEDESEESDEETEDEETEDEETEEETEDEEETDELSDEDKERMITEIDNMKVDEMLAMAKKAGVKGCEKFKSAPKGMRSYLKKQLGLI